MPDQRFLLANDIDGNPLNVLRPFGSGGYHLDAIDKNGSVTEGIVADTEPPASVRSRRARITTRLRSNLMKGSAA